MEYDVIRMVYNRSWKELNSLIKNGNIEVEAAAKEIIETQNGRFICDFAEHVKGAPIEELAQAIIELKKAFYICLFARFVEGAPIEKLAQAVIETQNALYIYFFARDIDGAPIDMLVNKLFELKMYEYILLIYVLRVVRHSESENKNELKWAVEQLIQELWQESNLSTQNGAPNMSDESQCYQAGDTAFDRTLADGEDTRSDGFSRERVFPSKED